MAEVKRPPRGPSPRICRSTVGAWTMAMSTFHRVTGGALYFGIALFAVWLVALASGPRAFEAVPGIFRLAARGS